MQLTVTGKGVDIGDALRGRIEENLPEAIGKYFDNPTDSQVTVSKEGHMFRVDIQVHVSKRILVQGQGHSTDAYSAYEEACEHVSKRLRRYKRRLRDHKGRGDEEALPAQQYLLQAEPEAPHGDDHAGDEPDQPVIVAEMPHLIETLSVGEAVMRMDLANVPALLFRNAKHGELNMVYQRSDGHIGWVDPQSVGGAAKS